MPSICALLSEGKGRERLCHLADQRPAHQLQPVGDGQRIADGSQPGGQHFQGEDGPGEKEQTACHDIPDVIRMASRHQGNPSQQQPQSGQHDDPQGEREQEQPPIHPRKIQRHMQKEHAGCQGDKHTERCRDELGYAAPDQKGRDFYRGDIDILQRAVVLAVVDDRPGDAGEHSRHVLVKGVAKKEIGEHRRIVIALADDRIHNHQDRRAGEWFHNRIGGEQKRIGPVAFDLPAQPGGGEK